MASRPATIDEYLTTVPLDRRTALERLRKTIRTILPNVEECISYSMPAFRLDGHVVAGFLSTKSGCSFFPFSGATLGTLADELSGYDRTKSALHFEADSVLPATLLRKLLETRIAETRTKAAKPSKKAAKPSRKTAKASERAAKPSKKTAKASERAAKPSERAAKPSERAAKPSRKTANRALGTRGVRVESR